MPRYMVFGDLASAQGRNGQEATARMCQPPTIDWWQTIEHPTNGQAALVIQDDGSYGAAADDRGLGGLTDDEISNLQPQSTLDDAGWFLPQRED
jgi:hypothetical protein